MSFASFFHDLFIDADFVEVLWLGGSKATGLEDEHSDIDLMVKVKDPSHVKKVFSLIEEKLQREITHTWDIGRNEVMKFDQKFYVLKNTGPYFYLDIAVFSESDPHFYSEYLNLGRHGTPHILFDKIHLFQTIAPAKDIISFNRENFLAQVEVMYRTCLKEIVREKFVDAFAFYFRFSHLYVTHLRSTRTPERTHYGLRYVRTDLGADDEKELSFLLKVNSLREMEEKLKWMNEKIKL